jgi:hypothetical protein
MVVLLVRDTLFAQRSTAMNAQKLGGPGDVEGKPTSEYGAQKADPSTDQLAGECTALRQMLCLLLEKSGIVDAIQQLSDVRGSRELPKAEFVCDNARGDHMLSHNG